MDVIEFSGKNHLEQALSVADKNFTAFTLQCWLRSSDYGPIFEYYGDESNFFSMEITPTGKIEFSSALAGKVETIQSVRGNINNSQWHKLTFMASDNGLAIFVNQKLAISKNVQEGASFSEQINTLLVGKSCNAQGESTFFSGQLVNISLWEQSFSDEDIITDNIHNDDFKGNLFSFDWPQKPLEHAVSAEAPLRQEVEINLVNDSPFSLHLEPILCSSETNDFPLVIKENSQVVIKISDFEVGFQKAAQYMNRQNPNVGLVIEVVKSQVAYESFVKVDVLPTLERSITVVSSSANRFEAQVRISENLVIVNANNLNNFMTKLSDEIGQDKIIKSLNYCAETEQATSSREQIIAYNQACQLFNRRLQKKPLAIVNCSSTSDVQKTYLAAKAHNLPISVRSGGHDHEGECSGTNTVLIDLIGLDDVNVDANGLATIGPGNRFIKLTTALAEHGVMIPHGTCATVAIPGFLMGGGWGPWTRRHGMCCEYLQKAEIVLGNGEVEIIDQDNKPELLWALKGGGGLSYGIVTKLFVQTFPLPNSMIKFELEWNCYQPDTQKLTENTPTIDILTRWEQVISAADTACLTGTNLKINGKPATPYFCANKVKHNCLMYGYWEGDQTSLERFIKQQFTDYGLKPEAQRIDGIGGLGTDYGKQLMSAWDRESFQNIQLNLAGQSGLPLPPDLDEPAPHKITSRLVDCQGLGDAGHKALLQSLTAPDILVGNRELGLFTYVTLGAIDGAYYQKMPDEDKVQSAFPYKDKLYTIQYQTWWNNELIEKEKLQNNPVYIRTNRALDWMEKSRDFDIPNTSGAFISFKDDSIPTSTYFAHNYQRLVEIKKQYSEDQYNHFRKRKTII